MLVGRWRNWLREFPRSLAAPSAGTRKPRRAFRLSLEPLEERTLLSANFATAPSLTAGVAPVVVVPGDFNSDGHADFAVLDSSPAGTGGTGGVVVKLGNGDGTFRNQFFIANPETTGAEPTAIVAGDFRGNGKTDLLLAFSDIGDTATLSLYQGNGDGTFVNPPNRTTLSGKVALSLATADFNGDGKLDFAVKYADATGTVGVFLGRGDGTFQSPKAFGTGADNTQHQFYSFSSLAVGDFNGDGKPDIATADGADLGKTSSASLLLGNGDGTFASAVTFGQVSTPVAVATGDFNGDGKLDLAVGDIGGNGAAFLRSIDVFLGNGNGSFQAQLVATASQRPTDLAVKDMNGDGKPDLVATAGNNVDVLLGNGDGSFQAPRSAILPPSPHSLAVGDFNGDTKPDLAVTNDVIYNGNPYGGGLVNVFLGNGDGTLFGVSEVASGLNNPTFAHDSSDAFYLQAVAAGDFNGDGKEDLLVSAYSGDVKSNVIRALLSNGDGTFRPGPTATVDRYPTSVVVADVNGDGKPDALVACYGGQHSNSGVAVLLGNGDGSFAPDLLLGTTDNFRGVAAGDFNGDGKADVFMSSGNIALGNGDGTFRANFHTSFQAASERFWATGDFNRDGKTDFVLDHTILLGNGDGTFQPGGTTFGANVFPSAGGVGDFNGDGKLDVAVVNIVDNKLLVFLGNGDGTTGPVFTLSAGANPTSVTVGDLDGDGKADLVVSDNQTNGQASRVTIFRGTADNSFPATTYGVGQNPVAVTLTDFNGDGAPDIATANQTNADLSVLRQVVGPAITGFTPGGGSVGDSVTITGTHFAGVSGVTFNGVPATNITVHSPTSITAVVPTGATTGPIGVTTVNGTAVSASNFTVSGAPAGATATSLALSLSPTTLYAGDTATLTAVVQAALAGGRATSGAVTFQVNGQTVAVVPVVNGVAQTQAQFDAGSVTIGADYADASTAFGPSSQDTTLQVNPPPDRHIPAGTKVFVTGADAGGGPDVKVFDAATHAVLFNFFPYDPRFTGGVRVAVGDVNADHVPDVVCVAGPGGGPNVVVFSGADHSVLYNFFAYDMHFTGGVFVAVGDVNGDGYGDIICGADKGGGPNVTVFSGADGSRLMSFFPYDTHFTGGVRVAAGDTDGDGKAEIITGAGGGGGPNITVFALTGDGQPQILQSYFAFADAFTAGTFVSAGDVNGDGKADILVGADAGGGPNVAVFNGPDHAFLSSFNAFDAAFIGGVRVSAAVQPSGLAELVAVEGPQTDPSRGPLSSPQVRVFDPLSGAQLDAFFAVDPAFTGGLYVAGNS